METHEQLNDIDKDLKWFMNQLAQGYTETSELVRAGVEDMKDYMDRTISSIASDDRVLSSLFKSLHYDGWNDREDSIKVTHGRTFKWIYSRRLTSERSIDG